MSTKLIRPILLLTAFVLVLQWSRLARADVTIMGTVGELGAGALLSQGQFGVRFKFTDATQTKNCNGGAGAGYAWFYLSDTVNGGTDGNAREWYAMLLVSKKGAPLSCTVGDNVGCHVTSCTLP